MIDFICFSINNWQKRKARKQQFMLHFSRIGSVGKVLYVEPALQLARLLVFPFTELGSVENRRRWMRGLCFRVEPLSDKLFIFTPLFIFPFAYRSEAIYTLNLFFSSAIIKCKCRRLGLRNPVLWFYHPWDYPLLKFFRSRILSVFDWAEEWSEYFTELKPGRRKKTKALEQKIIREVDLVFTVSQKLLEEARKERGDAYRILDGTVFEVFDGARGSVADDMKDIRKPIAGYLGTVSDRMDIGLLQALSKRFPALSIVLIGDILYPRVDVAQLRGCKNIYLLGGRSYEELGKYSCAFDVCILPYVMRPSTSQPTKIYDYLATGKPVVSVFLLELADFAGLIRLARTQEEFIELVREALEEHDAALAEARRQKARDNSWSARVEETLSIIESKI
jgi:hypothetical protein